MAVENLTEAKDLFKEYTKLDTSREEYKIKWTINLAFFKGRQYVFWNKAASRLNQIPVEDGEKPRHRVRLVSNQIAPYTNKLIAQMNKTKPVMHAKSGNSDLDSIQAASVAEQLLEDVESYTSMEYKKREALKWAAITGKGFWRMSWDDKAGDPTRLLLDPNGQPIINPLQKRIFQDELEAQGIDPDLLTHTLWPGQVRIDVISPFEIVVDPLATSMSHAKYAICCHAMSPAEVETRYGKKVPGDSKMQSPDSFITANGPTYTSEQNDAVKVYYGYFLPCATMPKGRYVVFTKDTILTDGPWSFPIKKLPFVEFVIDEFPGEMWSYGLVDKAVPLQKQLNRAISQIAEFTNLTVAPKMIAAYGSLRETPSNEPGSILQYNAVGNAPPPGYMQQPQMNPMVFNQIQDISVRLMQTFYQTEMQDGMVPPNIEAATAIDLLQEMSADGIAPLIDAFEKSIESAANIILEYCKVYYDLPRVLSIVGANNIAKAKAFFSVGANVKVESGSGMPRTRAGRQAAIERLVQMGVIPPHFAGKYLDTANAREIQAKIEADEDQALREHEKIMKSIPINPVAVQQAIAQVNTPDPQMGAPLAMIDPEGAQQMVQSAAYSPLAYENYAVHADIHAQFMKSPEFEGMDPEIQAVFIDHYQQTTAMLAQPEQVEKPNVTLQLRGAVGGKTAAAILNESGVDIPSDVVENDTPLDTVVFNSKDKPDSGTDLYMQELELKAKEAGLNIELEKADNESMVAEATAMEKLAKAQATLEKDGTS